MTNASTPAHKVAHLGTNGEITVQVPDLDPCLAQLGSGQMAFLDALDEMKSAYTHEDRIALIDQLILSLETFYVHQPMKWAKHAVDPVRALTSLRRICGQMGDLQFHAHVAGIFKSLRDIHTAYILPEPYRSSIWILPFTLQAYWGKDNPTPHIVVDGTLKGFPVETFRRGAELLTWNGRSIEEAVRMIGREESGSNPDAQLANGLRMMTIRWLGGSKVPDSHWVTLGYLAPAKDDGTERAYHEIRLSWRQLPAAQADDASQGWMIPLQSFLYFDQYVGKRITTADASSDYKSLDRSGALLQSLSRNLFDQSPSGALQAPGAEKIKDNVEPLETAMPQVFAVEKRTLVEGATSVDFGYIRIFNFMVDDAADFVAEFKRMLAIIPQDRLIIDLRGNAGGNPHCADLVMQFLTPHRIRPLPFEFLATSGADKWLNSPDPKADPDFGRWGGIVHDSAINGFMFSPSRTLTSEADANTTGQTYFGKVALLVDAITYSTGDIFSALFKDHAVGPIIGVSHMTGGGGADMMVHSEIVARAPNDMGFANLPHAAEMHLALRRCLRVGAAAGMPIEEAGVPVDVHHPRSLDDFHHNDRDLMCTALGAIDAL